MEAKYICGELPAAMGTCYGAIVFPNYMSHAQVARLLGVKPASAGMCRKDSEGNWYCFGYSQTLGLRASGEDEKYLNRLGSD